MQDVSSLVLALISCCTSPADIPRHWYEFPSRNEAEERSMTLYLIDLPPGPEFQHDVRSMTNLLRLSRIAKYIPHRVRLEIKRRLRNGEFHHTPTSLIARSLHPIWISRHELDAVSHNLEQAFVGASAIWYIFCGIYSGANFINHACSGQFYLIDKYNALFARATGAVHGAFMDAFGGVRSQGEVRLPLD
ncbi:hypothetical protein F66182_4489 [Fusarium sp. NRRL 66182]|nr:hypothetical protein F66182_4489 [Fusarium sp. NRRL 66182]